jgi:hypothetical protein
MASRKRGSLESIPEEDEVIPFVLFPPHAVAITCLLL